MFLFFFFWKCVSDSHPLLLPGLHGVTLCPLLGSTGGYPEPLPWGRHRLCQNCIPQRLGGPPLPLPALVMQSVSALLELDLSLISRSKSPSKMLMRRNLRKAEPYAGMQFLTLALLTFGAGSCVAMGPSWAQ